MTKAVTHTNHSDSEVALELSVEVRDEGGNSTPQGMVFVSPASMTLPPGASQQVEVTVDLTLGEPGLCDQSLCRGRGRTP